MKNIYLAFLPALLLIFSQNWETLRQTNWKEFFFFVYWLYLICFESPEIRFCVLFKFRFWNFLMLDSQSITWFFLMTLHLFNPVWISFQFFKIFFIDFPKRLMVLLILLLICLCEHVLVVNIYYEIYYWKLYGNPLNYLWNDILVWPEHSLLFACFLALYSVMVLVNVLLWPIARNFGFWKKESRMTYF